MKILLLEDDYNRVEQFRKRVDELNERNTHKETLELIHVETAQECINQLQDKSNKFALILLDHDLGGEVYVDANNTNTGSEVARWINNNQDILKHITVITHSFNPAGAKNITDLIPGCIHVPSLWTKDLFHKIIKY